MVIYSKLLFHLFNVSMRGAMKSNEFDMVAKTDSTTIQSSDQRNLLNETLAATDGERSHEKGANLSNYLKRSQANLCGWSCDRNVCLRVPSPHMRCDLRGCVRRHFESFLLIFAQSHRKSRMWRQPFSMLFLRKKAFCVLNGGQCKTYHYINTL